MSQKKSSSAKSWNILSLKWELMKRDPLGKELTQCLLRLYLDDPKGVEFDQLDQQRNTLTNQLTQKYDVESIYVPDPVVWASWQHVGLSREQIGERAWEPSGSEIPMSVELNWCPPRMMIRLIYDKETEQVSIVTHENLPCPRDGADPTVTITFNLAKITHWDLDRLAEEVKECLRTLLKQRPTERSPLSFLQNVHKQKFFRDLLRYDLHITHGLTFRLIALLEKLEEQGKTLDEQRRSQSLGFGVPGESSVRESVLRIYKAIHRKPYYARRRHLDTSGEGLSEYNCPDHGRDCDESCAYLKKWMAIFTRTQPTDHSGSSKTFRSVDQFALPDTLLESEEDPHE